MRIRLCSVSFLTGIDMAVAEELDGNSYGIAGLTLIDQPANYYPPLNDPVETKVIPITGRLAGGRAAVKGTLEGPVDESLAADKPPLVIFQGLLGVECAYSDLRTQLASGGRQWVLTYRPFRGEGVISAFDIRNAAHPVRT